MFFVIVSAIAAVISASVIIYGQAKSRALGSPEMVIRRTEQGPDNTLNVALRLIPGNDIVKYKSIRVKGHKVAYAWSKTGSLNEHQLHLWSPSGDFSNELELDVTLRPSDEPVDIFLIISACSCRNVFISAQSRFMWYKTVVCTDNTKAKRQHLDEPENFDIVHTYTSSKSGSSIHDEIGRNPPCCAANCGLTDRDIFAPVSVMTLSITRDRIRSA